MIWGLFSYFNFLPNITIIRVPNNNACEYFPDIMWPWLNEHMGYMWLIVMLLLLLAEIMTPGLFFFVSFAAGALVASILAFMGYTIVLQCIGGLFFTVLSFVILRSVLKGRNLSDVHYGESETNIDALVGMHGIVLKEVSALSGGSVKVRGEVWAAGCSENKSIESGSKVIIVKVNGNRLIVRKI